MYEDCSKINLLLIAEPACASESNGGSSAGRQYIKGLKQSLLGLLGDTRRTKAQIASVASVATGGCNKGASASKDSNVGSHSATALIGERNLERDMRSDRDGQKILSDSSLDCASAKKTPSSIR